MHIQYTIKIISERNTDKITVNAYDSNWIHIEAGLNQIKKK